MAHLGQIWIDFRQKRLETPAFVSSFSGAEEAFLQACYFFPPLFLYKETNMSSTSKDKSDGNALFQAVLGKLNNYQNGGNCSTVVPSLKVEEACAWYAHLFPNAPLCDTGHSSTLDYDRERPDGDYGEDVSTV